MDGLKAEPGTAKAKSIVGCCGKRSVSLQNVAIERII